MTVSINVRTFSLVKGEEYVEEIEPREIDPLAVTYLKASVFNGPEGGVQSCDLKISVRTGGLAITTSGNGVEVLDSLAQSQTDGFAHKFVQVTRYERLLDESQTGIGWLPSEEAEQIISVPAFLEQNR